MSVKRGFIQNPELADKQVWGDDSGEYSIHADGTLRRSDRRNRHIANIELVRVDGVPVSDLDNDVVTDYVDWVVDQFFGVGDHNGGECDGVTVWIDDFDGVRLQVLLDFKTIEVSICD